MKMKKTAIFYSIILICLLPTLLLRDYTPSTELRYLSIADEALRCHHLFAFTDGGEPFVDKPPLFLWLVMLGRMLPASLQHFYLGLLSVVPAFITIEVLARQMRLKDGRLMVFRLVNITAALFLVSMLTLRMDMLLTMFILLATAEFYRLYTTGSAHGGWRLPLLLFLGVFTKGPIGLIMPLAIIILFLFVKGRETDFFHYLGWRSWLFLFALLGIWFFGAWLEGGGDYLRSLLYHQTLADTIHSPHHREPIYYYLYMVWLLLLPWSLWAILSAVRAWNSDTPRSYEARIMVIFCLAGFVVLTLISSKVTVYLLPFVPTAISAIVLNNEKGNDRWVVLSLAIPYAILLLTLPAYVWLSAHEAIVKTVSDPLMWAACTSVSLAAAWALWLVCHKKVFRSACMMAVGMLLAVFLAGLTWPRINPFTGYRLLSMEAMKAARKYNTRTYVAVDLKHAGNMNVFIGEDPITYKKDGIGNLPHHAVVMTKAKNEGLLQLQDARVVGDKVVGYRK